MQEVLITDTAPASPVARRDLSPGIQEELAALAEIEARYEADCDRLDRPSASPEFKARRVQQLEE